ncbi:MAG: zinc resistance-associated protein [Deltaproteobacteria bacterium]|jgi:Spy/CpxP family protein refolding chaperone|nr:zinc resistance-associated protein [Deltaproteobacteria bacterium]
MKKIVIIGLSLILAMVLVAAVALAWGPGFGRGFGMGPGYGPPGNLFANLTPEQSAKIQALQQAHLQAIAPLQQELLAKGTELRSLSLNPNADPAVITAKQKEIWDLRSKLQEMTNNLRLQIREVLTPEQQAQFDTFGPRRGMGPRMGFGPGMGPTGRW